MNIIQKSSKKNSRLGKQGRSAWPIKYAATKILLQQGNILSMYERGKFIQEQVEDTVICTIQLHKLRVREEGGQTKSENLQSKQNPALTKTLRHS